MARALFVKKNRDKYLRVPSVKKFLTTLSVIFGENMANTKNKVKSSFRLGYAVGVLPIGLEPKPKRKKRRRGKFIADCRAGNLRITDFLTTFKCDSANNCKDNCIECSTFWNGFYESEDNHVQNAKDV